MLMTNIDHHGILVLRKFDGIDYYDFHYHVFNNITILPNCTSETVSYSLRHWEFLQLHGFLGLLVVIEWGAMAGPVEVGSWEKGPTSSSWDMGTLMDEKGGRGQITSWTHSNTCTLNYNVSTGVLKSVLSCTMHVLGCTMYVLSCTMHILGCTVCVLNCQSW